MRVTRLFPLFFLAACGGGHPHADLGVGDAAAPAPAPDLRFKWVGAFPCYEADESTNLHTLTRATYEGMEVWSPLVLGEGGGAPDGGIGDAGTYLGGAWALELFSPTTPVELVASIALADPVSRYAADLEDLPAGAVITSLDYDGVGNYGATLEAVDSSTIEYTPQVYKLVPRSQIDAFASMQATLGSVVTAVAWDGSQFHVFAIGRMGDTTSYETKVVDADASNLSAQVATLASGGYFITAMGRSATGYVLVGTHEPGDTTPRTAMVQTVTDFLNDGIAAIFGQGYVIVGWADTDGAELVVWEK